MGNKILIRAIADGGNVDMKIGEYEPDSIQPVIDLFLEHQWLDGSGEIQRAHKVLLLVHDFMPFHIELSGD